MPREMLVGVKFGRAGLKNLLRFLLRYKWLLRFGQWVLRRHPQMSSRLLGLADLTTPYVPARPLIAKKRKISLDISEELPPGQPRLLVDVSVVAQGDSRTGIQRVTHNLLHQLLLHPPAGYQVEPVSRTGQGYLYARRFTTQFMGKAAAGDDSPVQTRPGDVFFGLDLTLDMEPGDLAWLQRRTAAGLKIYFILHDLLPLTMPQYFRPQVESITLKWLKGVLTVADGIVSVSRATADDLANWLNTKPDLRSNLLKIGYFHHGADIESGAARPELTENDRKILEKIKERTSFLMVGTLEPRKGHAQALEALEELWRQNEDISLIIVGKEGWKTDQLAARLRRHPEFNRRLFWLDRAGDGLLLELYQNSTALLMASYGEGFGLPLIEAARFNLPLIVRDLPVFYEVAGDHAYYFQAQNGHQMAESLLIWLQLYRREQHPRSSGLHWQTWADSARQLTGVIISNQWYKVHPAAGSRSDDPE